MIAPYKQNFTVTQQYGYNGHRGIDLSAAWGVGDLTIICVVPGQCVHAGWDNGGYGYCVVIRDDLNRYWIYGHMSKVTIGVNGRVNQGEAVGVEGNTGASKGIHLHLEVRQGGWNRDNVSLNVADILGIPNRCGLVVNSQFQAPKTETNQVVANNTTAAAQTNTYNFKYIYSDKVKELQQILNSKGFTLAEDGLFGINTLNALRKYTIEINDSGALTKWTQEYLASKGYNVGYVDGLAGPQTMMGIEQFQRAKNLGTAKRNNYTYLGGDDWYYLIEG
jgi:murein DD-endopeptidase MepM/ murein hydrolase activator NlpD